jgi:hypothetical protein
MRAGGIKHPGDPVLPNVVEMVDHPLKLTEGEVGGTPIRLDLVI